MLGRFLFNRIGAVVLGVLALGVGFYMFSTVDVMCGSDAMQPGDTCVTTSHGTSTERSYDEQKRENALASYFAMGLGGVALVGGIVANVRHFRKSKAAQMPVPETPTAAA